MGYNERVPTLIAALLAISCGVLAGSLLVVIILAERERRSWRELLAARSLSEYAVAQRTMGRTPPKEPKPRSDDYLTVFDDGPSTSVVRT